MSTIDKFSASSQSPYPKARHIEYSRLDQQRLQIVHIRAIQLGDGVGLWNARQVADDCRHDAGQFALVQVPAANVDGGFIAAFAWLEPIPLAFPQAIVIDPAGLCLRLKSG